MGTTRKPITPTSGLEGQIKQQVEGGSFTTDRDRVRRDQEYFDTLAAIQAGLDSGTSERTMDAIWAEFEQRHRMKG